MKLMSTITNTQPHFGPRIAGCLRKSSSAAIIKAISSSTMGMSKGRYRMSSSISTSHLRGEELQVTSCKLKVDSTEKSILPRSVVWAGSAHWHRDFSILTRTKSTNRSLILTISGVFSVGSTTGNRGWSKSPHRGNFLTNDDVVGQSFYLTPRPPSLPGKGEIPLVGGDRCSCFPPRRED